MNKEQLIAEYEKVTGKKNGKFMSVEKLQEEISKLDVQPTVQDIDKAWDDMTEAERIAEAKRINSEQHKLMPDEIVPVFIKGEPFAIIENKYVPWADAMIIKEETNLKLAQERLAKLKATKA